MNRVRHHHREPQTPWGAMVAVTVGVVLLCVAALACAGWMVVG